MLLHKKPSIVNSILSLWVHLEARRKQQFVFLMALSLAGALAEVISLASVLPFLSILTEPVKVLNYPFIKHIAFFF